MIAEQICNELKDGGPDDEFYGAKLTVLAQENKHRVKEQDEPPPRVEPEPPQLPLLD